MEEKFLQQMTELLERDTPISMEDVFRNYDNWDSLAYLSVISFIDEEYELVVPRDEFVKLKTIRDILNYIVANR